MRPRVVEIHRQSVLEAPDERRLQRVICGGPIADRGVQIRVIEIRAARQETERRSVATHGGWLCSAIRGILRGIRPGIPVPASIKGRDVTPKLANIANLDDVAAELLLQLKIKLLVIRFGGIRGVRLETCARVLGRIGGESNIQNGARKSRCHKRSTGAALSDFPFVIHTAGASDRRTTIEGPLRLIVRWSACRAVAA